jgi:excisionase family DNA binding protein
LRLLRLLRLRGIFSQDRNLAMAAAETRDKLVTPDPAEAQVIARLNAEIDEIYREHGEARLLGPDGEMIGIPGSAFEALRLVVDAMSKGQTLVLAPQEEELTSQQAADLLRVSRPHLVKLLDEGRIPFHRVGTHRRVRLEDVLDFRRRRSEERREKLDELGRLSENFEGGYR